MENETNKHRTVRELREMADFIDSRPFDEDAMFSSPDVYIFLYDAVEFGKAVAAAGAVEKSADGMFLNADVLIGSSKIRIAINRDIVCKRVKVGERLVAAVPEHTVEAVSEHTEDIYDIQCPESFLALKDQHATDAEVEALVASETDM